MKGKHIWKRVSQFCNCRKCVRCGKLKVNAMTAAGSDEWRDTWREDELLTRGFEAADFVGAECYTVEVINAHRGEVARLRSEVERLEDRGDLLIYRNEYEALLADRQEVARLRDGLRRGINQLQGNIERADVARMLRSLLSGGQAESTKEQG